MPLLLTMLSVIAAVAFIGVLSIALLLIFKVLQSVERSLEQIAMGVRAIEQETKPLGDHARGFVSGLCETTAGVAEANQRLIEFERDVGAAF